MRSLLATDCFARLEESGKIVKTLGVDITVAGFEFVVEHERISFPSYSCEWCPQMLRDAGRLLLEILSELVEEGIVVADGHPWNILFDGCRPVFVDIGSFEAADEALVWPAYQQFCNLFLHPLYLCRVGLGRTARMLSMVGMDGVSTAECRSMLPLGFKLRHPGTWFRVVVPGILERLGRHVNLSEKLRETSRNVAANVDMRLTRRRFVRKLLKELDDLRFDSQGSQWTRYYDTDAPADMRAKLEVVSNVLDRIQPRSLLDVGCNTGLFSVLAARKNIRVVSLDTDEGCVSALYSKASSEDLPILPLIMDVVNHTPALGWMGKEYPSASARLKCDCVMALSVIHHLAFSQLQDFSRIVKSLAQFTTRFLIVEYVDKRDPMAEMLLKRCRHPVDFYTLDQFIHVLGTMFSKLERVSTYSPTRTLFVCQAEQ